MPTYHSLGFGCRIEHPMDIKQQYVTTKVMVNIVKHMYSGIYSSHPFSVAYNMHRHTLK